jgi:pantoate--beta-alanine ligase
VETIVAPGEMRARARRARQDSRRIGLVPTMGALHQGHVSLVRAARARADLIAMSIFVNPLQFGPGEDFDRYPRDPHGDGALAASAGVDVLWTPAVEAMYPAPPRVTVAPGPGGDVLEGAARPGHFAGVLTVVLKLFAWVEPDVAVFGRKDFQQAALIRAMVRDLSLRVEIVVAPTVRERDGVALSSRNRYLDGAARAAAPVLSRALARGVEVYRGGERRAAAIADAARRVAVERSGVVLDYVACADPDDLGAVETAGPATVLAIAARVGGTRLIDNVVLGEGLEGDVHLPG